MTPEELTEKAIELLAGYSDDMLDAYIVHLSHAIRFLQYAIDNATEGDELIAAAQLVKDRVEPHVKLCSDELERREKKEEDK